MTKARKESGPPHSSQITHTHTHTYTQSSSGKFCTPWGRNKMEQLFYRPETTIGQVSCRGRGEGVLRWNFFFFNTLCFVLSNISLHLFIRDKNGFQLSFSKVKVLRGKGFVFGGFCHFFLFFFLFSFSPYPLLCLFLF